MLRPTGLVIIGDTGKKIGEMVGERKEIEKNESSVVYRIPCSGCDRAYYGETYRGLTSRLKEHKADVRYHRDTNALVNHIDEYGHLPKLKGAEVVE